MSGHAWTAEQKENFRQKMRDYHAKRRAGQPVKPAKKPQPAVATVVAEPAEEEQEELESLEVEVQVAEPAPKTFKERMAARIQGITGLKAGKPAQAARRGKKTEVHFLTKSLPIISVVAATYAQGWFKDPYKACAPRREEITAIVAPLFNMIERRISISGKVTQDTLDLLASVMAMVGYAGRTYTTFIDIKQAQARGVATNEKAERTESSPVRQPAHEERNNDLTSREASLVHSFGRGAGEAAISRHLDDIDREFDSSIPGLQTSDDAERGAGDVTEDDTGRRTREAAVVAAAFKRDAIYRTQNGLL